MPSGRWGLVSGAGSGVADGGANRQGETNREGVAMTDDVRDWLFWGVFAVTCSSGGALVLYFLHVVTLWLTRATCSLQS